MAHRRDNPKFAQVSGYVLKELAISFKTTCTSLGLTFAEGMEQSIEKWLNQQQEKDQEVKQPMSKQPDKTNQNINQAWLDGLNDTDKMISAYCAGIASQAVQRISERSAGNAIMVSRCNTIKTKLAQILAELKTNGPAL